MKKCTMQDIADKLEISRVSVWKVFNNHEGVSESLKQKILQTAKELGYNKISEKDNTSVNKNICLIVSRPDSSIFWTSIIHDLAEKLSSLGFTLAYVSIPTNFYEGYQLPANLNKQNFDGAVIMNIYDTRLLKMVSKLDLPKVYLDSTTDITGKQLLGDLLVIEGLDTMRVITSHVIEKYNISNLGFIGDISYAKTNNDRFSGYLCALKEHNIEVNYDYCLTDNIGIYEYPKTINKFLDNLPSLPQALICASDFVAQFVFDYLLSHPEIDKSKLIITGFDGSTEYPAIIDKITTAYVNTAKIGIRLARQIEYRINNPSAPLEVTYLYPEIKYQDN
ncbi:MAG: LacI family DNA-binding transcriptional regulator [Pleomorphochaeta sp.]